MLLRLYSALWPLLTPLIKRYLKKRARQAPAYLEHWNERFGRSQPQPRGQQIWLHAVSVGETRAALPLVKALRARYPQASLLITQMTPTGRAIAQELYPDAQVHYLPYDNLRWMRRFVAAAQPACLLLMENRNLAGHDSRLPRRRRAGAAGERAVVGKIRRRLPPHRPPGAPGAATPERGGGTKPG